MKKKNDTLLLLCLFFTFYAYKSYSVGINFSALGNGESRIHVVFSEISGYNSNPEKQIEILLESLRSQVSYNTNAYQLPSFKKAVKVGNTGSYSINLINSKYSEYTGLDVGRVQTSLFNDSSTTWRPSIENIDENQWFPTSPVTLSNPSIIRDVRIMLLEINPVQYLAKDKTIRIYSEIEFDIFRTNESGENELLNTPGAVRSFTPIYQQILGADELTTLSSQAKPGRILIVSNDYAEINNALGPYILWKTKQGAKVDWHRITGTATTTQIRNVVQSYYSMMDYPLEYLVLVGDGGQGGYYDIPSYPYNYPWVSFSIYSDHTYATLAGNDMLADIVTTRFSVRNLTQLMTVINRTVNYESTPDTTNLSWFEKGWGYASLAGAHTTYSNRQAIRFTLDMMNRGGLNNIMYDEYGASASATLINTRLGNGAILWSNRPESVYAINSSNVQDVPNINRPFVSTHLTCHRGNWYGSSEELTETIIRLGSPTGPRGALANMCNNGPSRTDINNCITTAIFHSFGVYGAHTSGAMFLAGKFELWREYQGSQPDQVEYYSRNTTQMGDLTARLWNGSPQIIQCSLPDSVPLSQNRLLVQTSVNGIPKSGLIVNVFKRNSNGVSETFDTERSDENGITWLTLSNQTSGILYLTVSANHLGDNVYPLQKQIQIYPDNQSLSIQQIEWLDSYQAGYIGNGDGVINAGETGGLRFRLQDSQLLNRSVRGIISINPQLAQIIEDSNCIVSLDSTAAGVWSSFFRVRVFNDIIDSTILPLTIRLQNLNFQSLTSYGFNLFIRNFKFELVSIQYLENSQIVSRPSPGSLIQLRCTIQNHGSDASGIRIQLSSNHNGVRIEQPITSEITIGAGQTVTLDLSQSFLARFSTMLIPGTRIPLLIKPIAYSLSNQMHLTIPCGTITTTNPSGPDTYGYWAYENCDTILDFHTAYQWEELLQTYPGRTINLGLLDTGDDRDTSVAIRLPFQVQHYGLRYDSLTICSNGWVALGKQTGFNNHRNWRIPLRDGPRNILAVYWDNFLNFPTNGGVFYRYDSTEHRIIVTWRMQGYTTTQLNEIQVIIYDPNYYPTDTGDAVYKFQYKQLYYSQGETHSPYYGTIGIGDNDYIDGLEYFFNHSYPEGALPIQDGTNVQRSITFTTGTVPNFRIESPNWLDELVLGSNSIIRWTARLHNPFQVYLSRNLQDTSNLEMLSNRWYNSSDTLHWIVTGPTTDSALICLLDSSGVVLVWSDNPFSILISNTEENHTIQLPSFVTLEQNFPNPFNQSTTIRYALPQSGLVQIRVMDVHGREVRLLVNEKQPVGNHSLHFSAEGLPSGSYFYQLTTPSAIQTKRFTLIR